MRQRIGKLAGRHKGALYAAALAAALFLLFLIRNGITPFDDHTFLFEDMKRQYLSFIAHCHDILLGDESLYYSFRKGPGDDMIGFFAYYLTDPLLLILALVPVRLLPLAISLLLLLKISLIAFTCGLFLEAILPPRQESRAETLFLVLCSTSFAFSAYLMANLTNIMWLNAILLMPLLYLAALHLLQGGSLLPHVFLTALILYANYYIAYMVFLFEALAVLCFLIPGRIRESGRYLLSLVLGAALDAFLLLPTWFALSPSAKNSILLGFHPDLHIPSLPEIFSRLYSRTYEQSQIMEGSPHLYLGVLLLLPVLLFFLSGGVRIRHRIIMLILLCFLFISFVCAPLNLFWHAGTEPNGYRYRYAFLAVLLLTICALRGLYALLRAEVTSGKILIALILLLFGTIPVFAHSYPYLDRYSRFLNLFLIAVGAVLCFLLPITGKKKPVYSRVLLVIFTGLQLWDLLSNAGLIYRETGAFQTPASSFTAKYNDMRQAMEQLPPGNTLYRTESISPYEQNDAMLLGYNGITYYGSEAVLAERRFLKRIGFNDNGLYAEYSPDNTDTADAILGIRYLLDGRTARLTRSGLPMAFACEQFPILPDTDDPFSAQESLLSAMAGEEADLFIPAAAQCETDHPTRDGDIPYLFTVTPAADGELFFYLADCPGALNLMIDTGTGELLPYGNMANLQILSLGVQKAGADVSMTIHSYEKKLAGTPLFFTENADMLEAVSQRIRQDMGTVTCTNSADLLASFPAGIRSALLLIPYDESWHISANGHRVEDAPWADFYTMVSLPEIPENTPVCLHLQYVPKGMTAGIFISLLALIFICRFMAGKRRGH